MSQTSPRLDLPYLQPAQAQKHVIHNEALRRLDFFVHRACRASTRRTRPPRPRRATATRSFVAILRTFLMLTTSQGV